MARHLSTATLQDSGKPSPSQSPARAPAQEELAREPAAWYAVRAVLTITVVTLLLHGWALFDGVVLDDHWHQKGLREHGWSFSELLRTLVIAPADFVDCWWQTRPVVWNYFRPFFIVCMKAVYLTVGRGDETALHALSLVLHGLSSLMIWRLCLRLTGDRAWSLIGALVFAIYPHSVVTVAWPSSQNVVIQTTLLLGAMLTYLRAMRAAPAGGAALVATMLLWLLAIFTRENAVLFPAVLASFELAAGGWRRLWARRWFFIACGVVGVAFVAWRTGLGIEPLPDVYCRRPAGDAAGYAAWLAAKVLHYLCVSIWPAPMVAGPTGRLDPWSDAPGDCLLMLGIVCGLGVAYISATRRSRGWWIWPVWIVLSILPVAAVVATPHSGYMSGVGLAMGLAVAMTAPRRGEAAAAFARMGGGAPGLAPGPGGATVARAAVGLAVVLGMAFMAPVTRLQWMGTAAAERIVPGWAAASPPPATATDVFFINLPFVNIYIKPDMDKRLGPAFAPVRVHVLTFAPHATGMDRRGTIERVDAHSFVVAVEGQAYFSRLLGRFLVEGFSQPGHFAAGQTTRTDAFDVTILDADADGVWKLKFTFPRPLNDPSYCFYFTSAACGAARLRFDDAADRPGRRGGTAPGWINMRPHLDGEAELTQAAAYLEAGYAAAARPLFDIAADPAHPLRREAADLLTPVVETLATALGAPCQFMFDMPAPAAAEWAEARAWWTAAVEDRHLREVWLRRRDFEHLVWLRAENEFDRWIASGLVRTDLYLTGRPFDGPFGKP